MTPFALSGVVLAAILLALAGLILYQATRRAHQQAEELTRLNEIGRQLLRSRLSVEDLCELVYTLSRAIIPAAFFQIGLFDGDRYIIKVRVQDNEHLPEAEFPVGEGIVGWVRRTGRSLLVNDFLAERETLPAYPQWSAADPPRSAVFVPLLAGTAPIGVLAVQSRRPNHFSDEHLRLLTALANQAASAIQSAQLFERARERAEQLNLIGQVSAQISAVQPLPDLFRQIVTLTQQTFGYYVVSIYLLDPTADRLDAGASTSTDLLEQLPHIPVGLGLMGWAAREGQTALANVVSEDPRYRPADVLPETGSEIVLPLVAEGVVLGVLDVQSDRPNAFRDEDVFLLETLASQIAVAVEQAQSYAEKVEATQRLEALASVSRALVSVLNLDDLLDRVVDLIGETFDFERVHIFVKVSDKLVFKSGIGAHSIPWLVDGLSYTIGEKGLIPKVARTGEPLLYNDVSISADYRAGPHLEDTRSELVVPIKIADRVLGVMDVQSTEPSAFDHDDLELLQSLADSVAVAMRNAALYVSERRRRSVADALREINAAVASNLDLDSVLANIIDGMSVVLTLKSAAILLIDEERSALSIAATTESPDSIHGADLSLEDLNEDDPAAFIRSRYQGLVSSTQETEVIAVPLSVSGDLIGFLIVEELEGETISDADLEIVLTFANQAAVALNNARLYESQQAEAWVTTALLQVAEAVNTQMDVNAALATVARLTSLLTGVDSCVILRWNDPQQAYHLSAYYGVEADPKAAATLNIEDYPYLDLLSVTDSVLAAGEGHPLAIPEPLKTLMGADSVLGFPLEALGGPAGALIVDDPGGRLRDPRRMKILQGIAHQAGTALETADLQASAAERDRLEREIAVARSIQASFIPEAPPDLPGWEISATWRAARQVGGDFYDFIPLEGGRWGLVIADVADKGIPAALFMAVCRTMLRAVAVDLDSPTAVLSRLNELLLRDYNTGLFVTVFYAVWHPQTGQLIYANSGHNPPMVLRAGGKTEELPGRGIALGVINDVQLADHEVTLHTDDVLIAYTDGVTEAMRRDYAEWGLENLHNTVSTCSGCSADELLEQVLSSVEAYVEGAPQHDDLTLWVLRCVHSSASA
ncbi:MAG: GAF domain-containing protein [Chloroflexi bacterium]|nr:GAF domain-containing protein [Chloroflexota bacterium]